MKREWVDKANELVNSSESVLIVCHRSPDGDAIGSSLALWQYLKKRGANARVLVPDGFPKFLQWMPGSDQIVTHESEPEQAEQMVNEADLIFTLDFNDLSRVGKMSDLLRSHTGSFVMIDHHREPSDYADVTMSDATVSSTCEMIFSFIEDSGHADLIDTDIAQCLYCGIVTDTGSFRFSSVTSETHRMAAFLIDRGLDHEMVHRQVYDSNLLDRMRLVGYALSEKLVQLDDAKVAYIALSKDELASYNYRPGDTEGLVNQALSLVGVNMAAFIREGNNQVKLSLRSKGKFDVNEFARAHFNGGGHKNAAGGASSDSLEETTNRFIEAIQANQDKLDY
jgi:phosphoesterase RecJ-like protein